MDTQALVDRTYQRLGIGQRVFWTETETVENGLNPAQRILTLLKPDLYTLRQVVSQDIDDPLIDLRVKAPRCWRVQRVTMGDVTLQAPPSPSQGRMGDLRRVSLASLRGQRHWLQVFAPVPTQWYTHGLYLLGLYPRNRLAVTLTLTYAAMPTPLSWSTPAQEPDLPQQWHPVMADLAAPLLMMKEGKVEVQLAMETMERMLQAEPLRVLLKQMRAEKYREQAMAAKAGA